MHCVPTVFCASFGQQWQCWRVAKCFGVVGSVDRWCAPTVLAPRCEQFPGRLRAGPQWLSGECKRNTRTQRCLLVPFLCLIERRAGSMRCVGWLIPSLFFFFLATLRRCPSFTGQLANLPKHRTINGIVLQATVFKTVWLHTEFYGRQTGNHKNPRYIWSCTISGYVI